MDHRVEEAGANGAGSCNPDVDQRHGSVHDGEQLAAPDKLEHRAVDQPDGIAFGGAPEAGADITARPGGRLAQDDVAAFVQPDRQTVAVDADPLADRLDRLLAVHVHPRRFRAAFLPPQAAASRGAFGRSPGAR